MGLHRDGESLNLTPFETEMRRRLWWNLVILDAAWALLSGMTYPIISVNWTTKVPRNVNDADLFPGSTEPIQERDGPTEMGFTLLMTTIWGFVIKCHHQFPGFEAAVLGFDVESIGSKDRPAERLPIDVDSSQQLKYKSLLDQLRAELDKVVDKYIDPGAGAAHLVASRLPRLISAKVGQLFVPITELPEYGTEIFNMDDNLFRLGVYNIEGNLELYDLMNARGFMWYCRLHFQVEMLTALVGQLITRQTGSLVDRAWRALDGLFRHHPELYDMSSKPNITLRSFVLKAWKGRAQALTQRGQSAVMPYYVQELMRGLPEGRISESATPGSVVSSAVGGSSQKTGGQDFPNANTKWEYGPAHDHGSTDNGGFGPGLLDIGAVDWDMFADSVSSGHGAPGSSSGLGFGGLGPNIGPPW